MKKKNSDNKGLGLEKSKNESLGELKPSNTNDKETSVEGNGKRRVISKYLHPIFNKISMTISMRGNSCSSIHTWKMRLGMKTWTKS